MVATTRNGKRSQEWQAATNNDKEIPGTTRGPRIDKRLPGMASVSQERQAATRNGSGYQE